MVSTNYQHPYIVLLFFVFASCGITDVEPINEFPEEGTPTQFFLDGDPEIYFRHDPESPYIIDDEPILRFIVYAQDSIPHLYWLPTHLHVETDQGYSENLLLKPYACIVPIEGNNYEHFQFNFEWWSCNEFGINNQKVLSEEEIEEIERLTNSRIIYNYPFKTMPGGQYGFELINAAGRPAIQEAINTVKKLDYVIEMEEWEGVHHPNNFPICWLDDRVPPPPCPPWYLVWNIRISLDGENDRKIPVQEGGWVRATYTQPDGSTRSTTFIVPEIDV